MADRNFTDVDKKIFDYSGLWSWIICRRRGYYHTVRRIRPLAEASALSWGKLFHTALECGDVEIAQEIIKSGKLQEDERRTRTLLLERTQEYYKKYPPKTEPFEILDRELYVERELGEFRYCGLVDKKVLWRPTQKLRALEHKTASAIAANEEEKYSLDGQGFGYTFLLGDECEGVVMDITSSAKNPQQKFLRLYIPVHRGDVENWKKNITQQVEQVLECHRRKEYPMAFIKEVCAMYGRCPYYNVCRYGESIIPQQYYEEEK